MATPLQSLSHSDPERLADSQTKEACETKPPETGHLAPLLAQENVPGVSGTLVFGPHFPKEVKYHLDAVES